MVQRLVPREPQQLGNLSRIGSQIARASHQFRMPAEQCKRSLRQLELPYLLDQPHVCSDFFAGFAAGGVFHGFADFDGSAGEADLAWRGDALRSTNEQPAAVVALKANDRAMHAAVVLLWSAVVSFSRGHTPMIRIAACGDVACQVALRSRSEPLERQPSRIDSRSAACGKRR